MWKISLIFSSQNFWGPDHELSFWKWAYAPFYVYSPFPSRYDRRTNPRKRPKIVHRLFRSLIRNTFSCPWQHAVFHRSQWMRSSRISSVFYSKFVALWVLCKFIICEKGVFLYYLFSDSWHKKVSVYKVNFRPTSPTFDSYIVYRIFVNITNITYWVKLKYCQWSPVT